jgi:hypothetical protein
LGKASIESLAAGFHGAAGEVHNQTMLDPLYAPAA